MKCVVMYGDSLRCAMANSKICCRDLALMVGLSKSTMAVDSGLTLITVLLRKRLTTGLLLIGCVFALLVK